MKNRFGSTNEIGVFEMRQNGLVEVENPVSVENLQGNVEFEHVRFGYNEDMAATVHIHRLSTRYAPENH